MLNSLYHFRFRVRVFSLLSLSFFVFQVAGSEAVAQITDNREIVKDTKSGMAKFVGLVYFEDPRPKQSRPADKRERDIRIGSGTLISDRHIVTAAHVVTTLPNDFAPTIYFAPGHSGSFREPIASNPTPQSHPFGRFEVEGIYMNRNYYDPAESKTHDVAVLRLRANSNGKFPGEVVGGFAKLDCLWNITNTNTSIVTTKRFFVGDDWFRFSGYDSDMGSYSGTTQEYECFQVFRKGTIYSDEGGPPGLVWTIQTAFPLFASSCVGTSGGSGGPMWIETKDTGEPVVVGVVTRSRRQDSRLKGIVFTRKYLKWVSAGLK